MYNRSIICLSALLIGFISQNVQANRHHHYDHYYKNHRYYQSHNRISYLRHYSYRHNNTTRRFLPVSQRTRISANQARGPFYGKSLCSSAQFYCVPVYNGDTWARLFPNEEVRDLVMRINRTNVWVHSNGRRWIIVPRDLNEDYLSYSPLPSYLGKNGNKTIVISLSKNAFGAYNKSGELIHWGPISSKVSTPTGNFRIYRKQGPECISSSIPKPNGGAKMPYCMHYYKGYAIHAHILPGFHHSHGCVRTFKNDARWLNLDFAKIGTKVIVTN